MNEWLTVEEVALLVSHHPVTIRRLLKAGELHGHQRCTQAKWKVAPAAVDAWIKGLDGPAACGCIRLRSVRRSA